jgi:hypothetical protein
MTITGYADRTVFERYNVRRDDVQAHPLARQENYLSRKRGTTPTTVTPLRTPGGVGNSKAPVHRTPRYQILRDPLVTPRLPP